MSVQQYPDFGQKQTSTAIPKPKVPEPRMTPSDCSVMRTNPWWVTMRIGIALFLVCDLVIGYWVFSGTFTTALAAGHFGFILSHAIGGLTLFLVSCSDGLPERKVP
jgi:hypothetical protein